MRNKQLTYLDMPPDVQTPPPKVRPDAKLSDKNRIAESRHPSRSTEDAGGVAQGRAAEAAGAAVCRRPQQAPRRRESRHRRSPRSRRRALPPVQDPKLALPQQQQTRSRLSISAR